MVACWEESDFVDHHCESAGGVGAPAEAEDADSVAGGVYERGLGWEGGRRDSFALGIRSRLFFDNF